MCNSSPRGACSVIFPADGKEEIRLKKKRFDSARRTGSGSYYLGFIIENMEQFLHNHVRIKGLSSVSLNWADNSYRGVINDIKMQ